jgi:hypothetical protein
MAMKVFGTILVALAVFASAVRASAADLPPPLQTPKPDQGLEACAFITNNCETCVVDAAGKPSCSSVGIACLVTEKTCLIKKKAE